MQDPTRIEMETAVDLSRDPRVLHAAGVTVHGSKEFDMPIITHVGYNLWMGGCTSGLILPRDILHVVSLYPWETYVVAHEVRSALVVRMLDSVEQGFEQVDALAGWVNVCRDDGPTLVHCQAGLNRSGLVCARALMLGGMSAVGAIALLRRARGDAVLCNQAFEDWLLEWDEE